MDNFLTQSWPVRWANPQDHADIRQFFLNLDNDTRYMYYGAPTSDEIINDVWNIFTQQQGNEFFVVESNDCIVGVCHVSHGNQHAEIGLVVRSDFRNRGIASSLIKRAVVWCKTMGIQNIMLYHIPGNDIAGKIVRKYGLKPVMLSGQYEAKFEVPSAAPYDFQQEFVERTMSWWATFFKRIRTFVVGGKQTSCLQS